MPGTDPRSQGSGWEGVNVCSYAKQLRGPPVMGFATTLLFTT
jgi:hypothetical protein